MKTLIVEDDFTSRLFLQTFLSGYGECHIAVNGREAVQAYRMANDQESPYDLICMDMMMPELDGNEAVRQVRAMEDTGGVLAPNRVKIVMTTAVNDKEKVLRSCHELCDAYLLKPIDIARLLNELQSFQLVK